MDQILRIFRGEEAIRNLCKIVPTFTLVGRGLDTLLARATEPGSDRCRWSDDVVIGFAARGISGEILDFGTLIGPSSKEEALDNELIAIFLRSATYTEPEPVLTFDSEKKPVLMWPIADSKIKLFDLDANLRRNLDSNPVDHMAVPQQLPDNILHDLVAFEDGNRFSISYLCLHEDPFILKNATAKLSIDISEDWTRKFGARICLTTEKQKVLNTEDGSILNPRKNGDKANFNEVAFIFV